MTCFYCDSGWSIPQRITTIRESAVGQKWIIERIHTPPAPNLLALPNPPMKNEILHWNSTPEEGKREAKALKLQPACLFCVLVCVYEKERVPCFSTLSLFLSLFSLLSLSLSVPSYLSFTQTLLPFHCCRSQEPCTNQKAGFEKVGFVDFGKEMENISCFWTSQGAKPHLGHVSCVWWREGGIRQKRETVNNMQHWSTWTTFSSVKLHLCSRMLVTKNRTNTKTTNKNQNRENNSAI